MSISRRNALKVIGASSSLLAISGSSQSADAVDGDAAPFSSSWDKTHDRVWLGGDVWANPMEDWRVVDGAAECQTTGGNRNVHLVTHQLTNPKGAFKTSVVVTQLEVKKTDGGVGFKIGIKSDLNEFRSNCFAKNGTRAGLVDGSLVLAGKSKKIAADFKLKNVQLVLTGSPSGDNYQLNLEASDASGNQLGSISVSTSQAAVLGNIAIVNNFDPKLNKGRAARYRFSKWEVSGSAFTVTPGHRFGPILWSMYSLSDSRSDEGFVMKLSALTGPLGEKDNKDVELSVKAQDLKWKSLGKASLNTDAWTSTFRIPNWDEKNESQFKLVYREKHTDGTETVDEWTGKIKANPSGRPFRLGALTCQNDYAFPYEPVANNVTKLDPDMLYFSGDQLYESHGGYGIIRDPAVPAILNYLRKFYMFGWSFREAMRDRPTVCIADDHDVFQGNIWGESGAKMTEGSTSSKGGYREPARMVNVVHRTCTSHHPDVFDDTPVKQNISVYYGDMVYGGVSFAILGDRQFKSGPERVETGSGRADHVLDRKFDTSVLDTPGLVLLGERQEKFLEQWVNDWRSHSMKVLLSQTVFAGVATHHGGYNGYLKADLDSGGWPQTARDETIKIISKGMPLHINGDQHLTTLAQYGVDSQRDGCWSFCTPAIAAGYPRWWRPDEIGMPHKNRPKHGLANTGEYLDGFGNKVYVYAVGNPEVASKRNRYERAHQKGSGFGMVTIDPKAKTYTLESFRFLIDPTDGKATNQFPGWPVVIHQKENNGENVLS
jgi:alkaline phosphatase D